MSFVYPVVSCCDTLTLAGRALKLLTWRYARDSLPPFALLLVGHYTTTVTATNDVSSHRLSASFFVDEPIDGIMLTLLTPPVLVIGRGASGVTARVRADVTSGSNLTFEWDFADAGAFRTHQDDG